ncbi:peroxide stress protein YaaA [Halogeometricum borinquense]|uniref:Peroxide stress protein YaaA n=1 Tax=Halogeometricum borinquense TaxID=60847 RepID=A0A482T5Z8_9EURY|nr:DUF6884 domain-containing protein [Halogeometricum borinquense]RYJ08307.1 peroxide stress protein YaaA [Halogeometricum borinquense]
MPDLLLQGCSKRKRDITGTCPAIELYDGYFFRILGKAASENVLRDDIDVRILSAKYGLITPSRQIASYDQQMTLQRASELRESVIQTIKKEVSEGPYERIWVNLGNKYQQAIEGLDSEINADVQHLNGRLGVRGSCFKSLIRSDQPTMDRR